MLIWIIVLLFSAWLLIVSANLLINQTKAIADRFRLSKLFVSLVLMAIGTSLPELTVSSLALARNDSGLAISNIVGSNITNATLIFGIGIILGNLRIGTTKTQQNSWLLLIVTAIFVALRLSPLPLPTSGTLLVGIAIGAVIWQYFKAVQGRDHEDKLNFAKLISTQTSVWLIALKTFGGALLMIISGSLLVISIEHLSTFLNISTTQLGFTLAALATSLPELVSTIISQRQHEAKITVGNILGSNIYNLCFIGGVLSLRLKSVDPMFNELIILAITSLIFFAIIKFWKGIVVPQMIGIILILAYILYIFSTVWL